MLVAFIIWVNVKSTVLLSSMTEFGVFAHMYTFRGMCNLFISVFNKINLFVYIIIILQFNEFLILNNKT